MDIAILHCHFERGGVTQVVENHVRALANSDDRVFLVSDQRDGGLSDQTRRQVNQIQIAGFDYDRDDPAPGEAAPRAIDLADSLETALGRAGLSPEESVLHWHNHSLGKNAAMPGVVRRLAEKGWRFLLQIHDFAEDNRPENYRRLITASNASDRRSLDHYLYPVASQIHYATLTGGDADVLVGAGMAPSRVHCLPNSVRLPGEPPNRESSLAVVRSALSLPQDARWCLYPVRGIRRKNVAEFLLVCRWLPDHFFGGLTLCPATDIEARSYQRWREIAGEVSPRAVFDAGQHPDLPFIENLAASEFVISTSVAEGFGMAFLEPWLAHRPVIARRLPAATDDFEKAGVRLDALYQEIPIPGDSSWLKQCHQESLQAHQEAWSPVPEEFRPGVGPAELDRDPTNLPRNTIDFGQLTPTRQHEVLKRCCRDPEFETAVKELSKKLIGDLHHPPGENDIAQNAQTVGEHYSTESQCRQLRQIYRELLDTNLDRSVNGAESDTAVVDLVNRMRPFYPCRTENAASMEAHF